MSEPLVSVVMPAYNHERYVGEAIESVLGQTCTEIELIVIDDGSTDQSAQVIAGFTDPRIRYLYQSNSGAHVALNRGFGLARGDFVAVLNSDDVYHPDRLRHALDAMAAEGADAFFSGYNFIDDQSQVIRASDEILAGAQVPDRLIAQPIPGLSQQDQWVLALLSGNFLHTLSNLVLRRAVFPDVGAFHPWRYVHDYDFFLRLCSRFKATFDQRPLLGYRFHETNTLGESPVASVLETTQVLHEFFARWHPSDVRYDETIAGIFLHLLEKLRAYGADRLLLALILADRLSISADSGDLERARLHPLDLPDIRERVVIHLNAAIHQDRLAAELAWQREISERWWKTSQERGADLNQLRDNIAWQEEQTTSWWRQAQECDVILTKKVQELKDAHHRLDATSLELDDTRGRLASITTAFAAHRRYWGLYGVAHAVKTRFHDLLRKMGNPHGF